LENQSAKPEKPVRQGAIRKKLPEKKGCGENRHTLENR
jgi:hypothetical protein